MGLRHRSIRLRIFLLVAIPILSLVGLYVFAATITASDALNLARSRTLKDTIGTPVGNLEAQIDLERMQAVVYLAAPVPSNLAALHAQEAKTEQSQKAFTDAVNSAASSAGPAEKQAIAVLVKDTAGLAALRSKIVSLAITRPEVISAYAAINFAADEVLNQTILQESNVPLVTQSLALVRAGKSEELLLEESALLNGDAIARTFSQADRQQFTELAGAHRTMYTQALPDLEPAYRAYFLKDISPQASAALTALENKVIADNHPGRVPPVSLPSWNLAVGAVSAGLSNASIQAATTLTMQAQPVANATFLRLWLVGGLGLLAIILSLIISVWIGRGLLQQLAGLRRSALDLANKPPARPRGAAALRGGRGRGRRGPAAGSRVPMRSDRSRRPSTPSSGRPWRRPWTKPGFAAGSVTSSATWPGAASRCCTASWPCSTPWNAGPLSPRNSRTCSASTISPPGCAGIRRD